MSAQDAEELALEAAVQWRVRQESARFGRAELQAFERWLAAGPQHQAAWARVSGLLEGPISTVRVFRANDGPAHAQAAMQALVRVRRRRLLRGALAVAGVGGATGLVADRLTPLAALTADLRTGTGERRGFTLHDGTVLTLDARSSVDVTRSPEAPALRLRAGALIASRRAMDATSALDIRTVHGSVQMQGGRVMCRLLEAQTEVVALAQSAAVQPREAGPITLSAGEGARFSSIEVHRMAGAPADRATWQGGMLAADDWPLGEVVEAIRAYHAGFIRVSAAAAALRVFGIFRLDANEVLDTVARTVPVQVHRLGPWLTSIDVDTGRIAR